MEKPEVVQRLRKLHKYISDNAWKAKSPQHKDEILKDAMALDIAIFILDDKQVFELTDPFIGQDATDGSDSDD